MCVALMWLKNKRREEQQVAGSGDWTLQRLPGAALSLWVIVSLAGRQTGGHACAAVGEGEGREVLFEAQVGLQHIWITDSLLTFSLEVFCLHKCTIEQRLHHLSFVWECDVKSRKCGVWTQNQKMQTWPLVTRLSLCTSLFFSFTTITSEAISFRYIST